MLDSESANLLRIKNKKGEIINFREDIMEIINDTEINNDSIINKTFNILYTD